MKNIVNVPSILKLSFMFKYVYILKYLTLTPEKLNIFYI